MINLLKKLHKKYEDELGTSVISVCLEFKIIKIDKDIFICGINIEDLKENPLLIDLKEKLEVEGDLKEYFLSNIKKDYEPFEIEIEYSVGLCEGKDEYIESPYQEFSHSIYDYGEFIEKMLKKKLG